MLRSIIQMLKAKLFGSKKGRPPMLEKLTCTNCGWVLSKDRMTSCRMLDRCVPSQNTAIATAFTEDQLVDKLSSGRAYSDGGRPLCYPCAEDNKYVCYVCELESTVGA